MIDVIIYIYINKHKYICNVIDDYRDEDLSVA